MVYNVNHDTHNQFIIFQSLNVNQKTQREKKKDKHNLHKHIQWPYIKKITTNDLLLLPGFGALT